MYIIFTSYNIINLFIVIKLDVEDESSDDVDSPIKEDGTLTVERPKVRSRFRHHKQRIVNVPIGIFWDIENCQVKVTCMLDGNIMY